MLLEGRVAIVSGVGPGMGRDISLALARAGADLVLGARTRSALEAVGEQVEALGRRVQCVPTDITDPDQCRLVNNAFAEEDWHRFDGFDVAPGHIWGRSLPTYIAATTALNHIATSEEIARVVLFSASDLSRVITGQTLDVNCGRTLN